MSKQTIYVIYFSFAAEAIKKNDLSICIRPYEVELDPTFINEYNSLTLRVLNNCFDMTNNLFKDKIILKAFETEAYSDYDTAVKEFNKYY